MWHEPSPGSLHPSLDQRSVICRVPDSVPYSSLIPKSIVIGAYFLVPFYGHYYIPKVIISKQGRNVTMKYGYARVSSDSQDYSAQVEALKAAGCERI